ncbi:MAG: hypothetical protein COT13_04540 [Chloroflexi bacterium CG08_land_8_20_14_0_20_45_12]|nr:MAG: hypothetical protein COT13_04540 [Chloroflexi bacterium CG08_land_8_20_14_0_20_45_12]
MQILLFTLIFLLLDVAMNLISLKVTKLLGMDFLFFASWLAGMNYEVSQGIVVSLVLIAEHSMLHMRKSKFIGFSLPAQIGAVLLGHFLGAGWFFGSLIIYQVINTGLMSIIGGIGLRFGIFLVVNTLFNILVYNIWSRVV